MVGNKFVDLVRLERERFNLESLEQKYGYEHDQEISDAAGKTLKLVELLKNLTDENDDSPVSDADRQPASAKEPKAARSSETDKRFAFKFELFAVNKWLLLATIIILCASGGLFFWANQSSNDSSSAESASDVNFANSELKDYVRSGRSTPGTLYAITQPSWDQLPDDKKKDLLRQGLELAGKTGQKNVQFVNARGRVEAYASADKIEILNP
jgi:hypothetical protein